MITSSGPLDYERHALRWTLQRLIREEKNLESLCKNVPRLASVVANVMRIEAALKNATATQDFDAVRRALRELVEERTNDQEESTW